MPARADASGFAAFALRCHDGEQVPREQFIYLSFCEPINDAGAKMYEEALALAATPTGARDPLARSRGRS